MKYVKGTWFIEFSIRLSCVSPNSCVEALIRVPYKVAVCSDRAFKEVIKRGPTGGALLNIWLLSLSEEEGS